jgi:hypothetical protein
MSEKAIWEQNFEIVRRVWEALPAVAKAAKVGHRSDP